MILEIGLSAHLLPSTPFELFNVGITCGLLLVPLLSSGLVGVNQKVKSLLFDLLELLGAAVLLGIRLNSRLERP